MRPLRHRRRPLFAGVPRAEPETHHNGRVGHTGTTSAPTVHVSHPFLPTFCGCSRSEFLFPHRQHRHHLRENSLAQLQRHRDRDRPSVTATWVGPALIGGGFPTTRPSHRSPLAFDQSSPGMQSARPARRGPRSLRGWRAGKAGLAATSVTSKTLATLATSALTTSTGHPAPSWGADPAARRWPRSRRRRRAPGVANLVPQMLGTWPVLARLPLRDTEGTEAAKGIGGPCRADLGVALRSRLRHRRCCCDSLAGVRTDFHGLCEVAG
jgi:hypothetical protein